MKARDITLPQFTYTFVPFAILLSAALLAAEATLDLPQFRMIYSIWVSLGLAIPALCLYILPNGTQARRNYMTLFWTFAYCAYLVHFYFAAFVHYHGSLPEMFANQGLKIAGPNLLVTVWWGFDVVLAWTTDSASRWIRVQRALVHFLVAAIFFVSSVLIFRGFVNILGYAMTAGIVICLGVRLFAKSPALAARMEAAVR
jgi:hypothetical protein